MATYHSVESVKMVLTALALGGLLLGTQMDPRWALAHVPVTVEVLQPRPEAVVDGPDVRVVLKASGEGLAQPVAVDVLIDGSYVHPKTGELSARRSTFGGPMLGAGETSRLMVRGVGEGSHRLQVIVHSHHGEEAPLEHRFFVGSRPVWGVPVGLAIGIVVVLGAAGLAVANRRRA